jgi:hypothetical protein
VRPYENYLLLVPGIGEIPALRLLYGFHDSPHFPCVYAFDSAGRLVSYVEACAAAHVNEGSSRCQTASTPPIVLPTYPQSGTPARKPPLCPMPSAECGVSCGGPSLLPERQCRHVGFKTAHLPPPGKPPKECVSGAPPDATPTPPRQDEVLGHSHNVWSSCDHRTLPHKRKPCQFGTDPDEGRKAVVS